MAPVNRREYFAALGRLSMATRTAAERASFARIGSLTAGRNETQHRWTSATAREAGLKGALASVASRKAAAGHGLWRKRDDRELEEVCVRALERLEAEGSEATKGQDAIPTP